MLSKIHNKLNKEISNKDYTEEELNQIAAKEIQQAIRSKSTSFSALDYYIPVPGFGQLNKDEIRLAERNPLEFTKYANAKKRSL